MRDDGLSNRFLHEIERINPIVKIHLQIKAALDCKNDSVWADIERFTYLFFYQPSLPRLNNVCQLLQQIRGVFWHRVQGVAEVAEPFIVQLLRGKPNSRGSNWSHVLIPKRIQGILEDLIRANVNCQGTNVILHPCDTRSDSYQCTGRRRWYQRGLMHRQTSKRQSRSRQ